MSLKKVLIAGPISDFGGREIEVKNIANALADDFDVDLLSTIPMTKDSVVLKASRFNKWSTIDKKIYSSNFFIRLTSITCKLFYGRKEPAYRLIGNKINHRFFVFNQKYLETLKAEITKYEAVIFCCELTTKWLEEVIEICKAYNKTLIVRTTGTIKSIPNTIKSLLVDIDSIIIHSTNNLNKLLEISKNGANTILIDQTTLIEEDLINIEISENNKQLTYGYLGRFSKEKGIIELLRSFEKLDKKLVLAGSGPLLHKVTEFSENNDNIKYLGELQSKALIDFFVNIDVLVIPSFEEAGPLVGIEAMAAGKLILSTRVGAMMDRLKRTKNQFWFDINKDESLMDVISEIECFSSETRIEARRELRKIYKVEYSKNVISNKYLNLIKNTIKNKKHQVS